MATIAEQIEQLTRYIEQIDTTFDDGMSAWQSGLAVADGARDRTWNSEIESLAATVVRAGDQMLDAMTALKEKLREQRDRLARETTQV